MTKKQRHAITLLMTFHVEVPWDYNPDVTSLLYR